MSIASFESSLLAQRLCDTLLSGRSAALPESWRALAEHLCTLDRNDHASTFEALVPEGAKRDELIKVLASVPPTGPAAARCSRAADGGADVLASVPPTGPAAAGAASQPKPGEVVLHVAADIQTLPVQWLWQPRVPLGALTLFAGDPKLGKSLVTLGLAAAISRGAILPGDDGYYEPVSAVLMSAEDDPARTIVPRLKSAGADLSKIYILEAVVQEDGTYALPRLRFDIERISLAVMRLGGCRLVVIDPVSAYLGGVDDHRNAELRGVLSPLKQLAEDLNLAVVLVSHLNKGASPNGQHRVAGSIAYVGACRANFLFLRDRRDPNGRRVLMLDNGCNLTTSVPTLAYQIEDRGDGPVVSWEADAVPITTEDALRALAVDQNDHREASDCGQWLRQRLSAGAVPVAQLLSDGRDAGFSKDQLKRAKMRIGAATRRAGFGATSTRAWTLDVEEGSRQNRSGAGL